MDYEKSPDIDEVCMVDDVIKKYSGLTVEELYKKLPKKISKEKFKTALVYFLDLGYITVDDSKHITWSGRDQWG